MVFVFEGVKWVSDCLFLDYEVNWFGNILLFVGCYGLVFIVMENFYVIKEYNESDIYVFFIGYLVDCYGNNKVFVVGWKLMKEIICGVVCNF